MHSNPTSYPTIYQTFIDVYFARRSYPGQIHRMCLKRTRPQNTSVGFPSLVLPIPFAAGRGSNLAMFSSCVCFLGCFDVVITGVSHSISSAFSRPYRVEHFSTSPTERWEIERRTLMANPAGRSAFSKDHIEEWFGHPQVSRLPVVWLLGVFNPDPVCSPAGPPGDTTCNRWEVTVQTSKPSRRQHL